MERFLDSRSARVCRDGYASGIPKHVGHRAKWLASLLFAARERRDLKVIGELVTWPSAPSRLGLHIDGKWYATFSWSADFGVHSVKIERK